MSTTSNTVGLTQRVLTSLLYMGSHDKMPTHVSVGYQGNTPPSGDKNINQLSI